MVSNSPVLHSNFNSSYMQSVVKNILRIFGEIFLSTDICWFCIFRGKQNLLLRNLSWNDFWSRVAAITISRNFKWQKKRISWNFSVKYRSQIENQISDYMSLRTSSLYYLRIKHNLTSCSYCMYFQLISSSSWYALLAHDDMGKFEIHEKSSNWHCHEENEPAILSKYTCVFVLLINICNIFQKKLSIFYEKKVKTVMVNSSTNINKTNNCL